MNQNYVETILLCSQGVILIIFAPLVVGWLRCLEDMWQGRQRFLTHIWQPYRDIIKLIKKPGIKSISPTSWLFSATPLFLFGLYGALAFAVPVFYHTALISTDLIVVVYVLAFARFIVSLAGLDSGAPFGGLGSSREMFQHFLTEFGLIIVLAALMLDQGTLDLTKIVIKHTNLGVNMFSANHILTGLALALLVIFETGRIPIDNPSTHLELTMSQKAITLEYAGWHLALIEWAEMVKMTFLLTLLIKLFLIFPIFSSIDASGLGVSNLFFAIDYFVKAILIVVVLAIWETNQPKLRLRRIVQPAMLSIVFSLIAIIYTIASVSSS